jgi:hypothetical protein
MAFQDDDQSRLLQVMIPITYSCDWVERQKLSFILVDDNTVDQDILLR